jgi:hypothetical protein
VVPLAGQYFVYFQRICHYFFVAREVQRVKFCSSSATISSLWLTQCCPLMGRLFFVPYLLLDSAVSHLKKVCNHFLYVPSIPTSCPIRIMSRTLTVISTGTKTRPHPLPIVSLTMQPEKNPAHRVFRARRHVHVIWSPCPLPTSRSHAIRVRSIRNLVPVSQWYPATKCCIKLQHPRCI